MISPPTDSLYKFCAILGLILTVFNSYYNFEMLSKTGHDLIILMGEHKKYNYQLNLHETRAIEFDEELKLAIKFGRDYIKKQEVLINASKNNSLNKQELKDLKFDVGIDEDFFSKNQKYIDSLNKITKQEFEVLKYKQIEIDTKHELIEHENKKSKMYSKYLFAGIILGFLLTFFGFYNWIKLQKQIDKNLYKPQ